MFRLVRHFMPVAVVLLFVSLLSMRAQGAPKIHAIVTDDTLDLLDPALSPDGRWLVVKRAVSSQETQLMIRPIGGGPFRPLSLDSGMHVDAHFSPNGDHLFFISTLPRRSSSDTKQYLMSVSFDTRSGTTSGTPRQITLDGVAANFRVSYDVSPDGQTVAYVECCERNELRVVPANGGNARSLTSGTIGNPQLAGYATFTADGRAVLYHKKENNVSAIWRVPITGGKPVLVTRTPYIVGAIAPGGRYFTSYDWWRRRYLHVRTLDGREVASFSTPKASGWRFTPDGTSLAGVSINKRAAVKVVSIADGSTHTIGRGEVYEWADGWSADSRTIYVEIPDSTGGPASMRLTTLDGKTDRELTLPVQNLPKALKGNQWVYGELVPGKTNAYRILFKDIATGRTRVVVQNALFGYGVSAPTGDYYGLPGDEYFYVLEKGSSLLVRALAMDGTTRLVGEAPKPINGQIGFAVHGQKLAYSTHVGDSTTLSIVAPGRTKQVVMAGKTGIGEFAFSKNGRQFALYTNGGQQRIHIF